MKVIKGIFAAIAGLILATSVPGATLPPLPTDPSIQTGTLGCGAAYYLVKAPVRKGYASIALVQQGDSITLEKREALSPAFFERMGIGPGKDGYLTRRDGSTVYRFSDIPFYRKESLDSMLLYTFSRMAESSSPQAIIISGDIEPVAELKKKMDVFSMLVRKLPSPAPPQEFQWNPHTAGTADCTLAPWASVSVTYSGNRIAPKYMNTAQALVTDIFGMEFQVLLRHRLDKEFARAGIAHSDFSFSAVRSGDFDGYTPMSRSPYT